ncbi:hypothetical protein B0H10DRAFT_696153 [Mycena sp. CBHHK59/15]|nr:hypothetical protein B0H10DRAFT_696153 [Mycena sp. CBHHK59/15]
MDECCGLLCVCVTFIGLISSAFRFCAATSVFKVCNCRCCRNEDDDYIDNVMSDFGPHSDHRPLADKPPDEAKDPYARTQSLMQMQSPMQMPAPNQMDDPQSHPPQFSPDPPDYRTIRDEIQPIQRLLPSPPLRNSEQRITTGAVYAIYSQIAWLILFRERSSLAHRKRNPIEKSVVSGTLRRLLFLCVQRRKATSSVRSKILVYVLDLAAMLKTSLANIRSKILLGWSGNNQETYYPSIHRPDVHTNRAKTSVPVMLLYL